MTSLLIVTAADTAPLRLLSQPEGRRRLAHGEKPVAPSKKMTMDERLDEALKQTFPASDAFELLPDPMGQAPPADTG